jgi:hypothetical protein
MRLIAVQLRNTDPRIPSKYMIWPMMLDERDVRTPDDVRDDAEGLPSRWWFDEKYKQRYFEEVCSCCGQEI